MTINEAKKEYARRSGLCFQDGGFFRDEGHAEACACSEGIDAPLSEWEVLASPEYLRKVFVGIKYDYPKWKVHAQTVSTMSLPERWEYVAENLK